MTKATHRGHCQACGRLQLLPNGILSLHGYTVESGFFSGVCRGARHLPFELSCNLVRTFIAEAEKSIADDETYHAYLLKLATEPVCWVQNFERTLRGSGYVWRKVTILDERGPHGCGRSYMAPGTQMDAPRGDDVRHGLQDYSYGRKTLLEQATEENIKYAEKVVLRRIQQLRRYVAWQESRVETWQAAPLFPVTHKDKEGFQMEEGQ